jgi:hypothetical protein
MKPCRRGHDRNDSENIYVYTCPTTGFQNIICKRCQKENYDNNKQKYNAARRKLWAEKGY